MVGRKLDNIYVEAMDCYKLTIPYKNILYDVLFDKHMYNIISQYQWHLNMKSNTFYASTRVNSKLCPMHRIILNDYKSPCIDHIDGNGLNNRVCNLRQATYSQNMMNSRTNKYNKLGIKGVYYDVSRKKYRAHIKYNGKKFHLGNYEYITHAIYVRFIIENTLFGEYRNKTNDLYIIQLMSALSNNDKLILDKYIKNKLINIRVC